MTSERQLLEVRELTRHYGVSRGLFKAKTVVRALDGVSFTVAKGETLAVVGESGCGKSTLARQVTMLERPTSGVLRLLDVDVAHADALTLKRLRPLVQMVFQNPYASLNPRKTVGSLLEEPLAINATLGRAERREAAQAMLAKVGLRPEHYGRYPHMFSGGQRQRVAVARSLMLSPQLVVADEPVSALDVSIQAQVLNLLMDLQRDLQIAYLFISHNLQVVRHIAAAVAVMYLGKIVEYGPAADVFTRAAHPYTRALLASTPTLKRRMQRERVAPTRDPMGNPMGDSMGNPMGNPIGEPPSPLAPPAGCAFHQRCPYVIERCRNEAPALLPLGRVRVACHRAAEINT